MKRFIASLPPQAEMAIVLLSAFGIFVVSSVLMATGVADVPAMNNARLMGLLIYEMTVLALLGSLLWARGWTLERLGIATPVLQDLIDAAGLVVVAYLIPACIVPFLPAELRQSVGVPFVALPLSLPLVTATSLINPVFEEIFVVGYVFAALRGVNVAWAINVSIALRIAYHLYQGPASVVFILPLAVVFGWWYSTRPSLWPLMIAHAALDFLALARHIG